MKIENLSLSLEVFKRYGDKVRLSISGQDEILIARISPELMSKVDIRILKAIGWELEYSSRFFYTELGDK